MTSLPQERAGTASAVYSAAQRVKQARAFIPHPPGLLRDVCEGAIRTIGFQL